MLDLIAAMVVALAGQDAASPPAPVRPEHSLDLVPLSVRSDPAAEQQIGAEAVSIFSQVVPHWRLHCDNPDLIRHRIQFDLVLDRHGRIIDGPTVVNPRNDPYWRAAADGARYALIAAAPFDVPEGFTGGRYRPTFNPARACAAD